MKLIKEVKTVTQVHKDGSGNILEETITTTVKEYTYAPEDPVLPLWGQIKTHPQTTEVWYSSITEGESTNKKKEEERD